MRLFAPSPDRSAAHPGFLESLLAWPCCSLAFVRALPPLQWGQDRGSRVGGQLTRDERDWGWDERVEEWEFVLQGVWAGCGLFAALRWQILATNAAGYA
jgi:hypothetical protein